MKILAICGSIRVSSSNQQLIEVLKAKLPKSTQCHEFSLKELPYFDPDLQFGEKIPVSVSVFRQLVKEADVLLISTPEYAHGIPGILKNALEWLICEETMEKRVAIMIGSPSGGEYVKAHLLETLKTMDLIPSEEQIIVVPDARKISANELSLRLENFIHGTLKV